MIGLGRMGGGLAWQALGKGMRVVGFDVHPPDGELASRGLVAASGLGDLVSKLETPRTLLLFIHSGPAIDDQIAELAPLLSPGDIVVDGGNSYWGDSIRRHRALREHGIFWVDLGTSGGIDGARNGACMMVGGDPEAAAAVEPVLRPLCVPGGYVYAGGPGCGHFVKLVHNGIEFGMLQAIGEGVDLLEHFDEKLDVEKILSCWQNGSVVRSWLIDLMREGYAAHPGMADVPAYVEDTGEVNWLVSDALRMEVPIPVISASVMQLLASRDEEKPWAKAIALMRHGFGGHAFGAVPSIAHDRQIGRVGDIYRPDAE